MLSIKTNFDDNMSPVTEYCWDIYDENEENEYSKPVLWVTSNNHFRGYADNYDNELNITNIYNHIIILKEKIHFSKEKYDKSIIDIIYNHETMYNKNFKTNKALKTLIYNILMVEELID